MAQLQTVIAGRLVKTMPPVPLKRLGDDPRHQLEGTRNAGDKAKRGQSGGSVLGVQFGIGYQTAIPGEGLYY